ncbi:MAG: N-acyl homoserine lactonase family protein [Candidatus Acidiferrum sp.]|jgi:glyoxylase-like metal-dependent hydrolase (beta-lactamase superfamily II)
MVNKKRFAAVSASSICLTLLCLGGALLAHPAAPDYSIQAIRYASSPDVPVSGLVVDGPKDVRVDIAMVVWLIRGGGHTILFDSGFHRDTFLKYFPMKDYLRPDEAVKLAGVQPEEVTDIVISHAHWDHMGGIDLFPKANVWIQKDEYRYYTMDAWQPGGNHGGIDPEDVKQLVQLNTEGRIKLVDGDNVEIFPGIRAYTGSRHTYASEYLRVEGSPPFVLASDNCYLYLNLAMHKASATFSEADHAANIAAQSRMIELAGGNADRVIPGHDPEQFKKYPTDGRVAKIR